MAKIKGRCLCGAVLWQSPGPVLWAGHCHCESCRRATSAQFASFFGVPRAAADWSGNLIKHSTSSGRVTRKFCAACGSQMSYENEKWPDEIHLYAASLDDPSLFIPEAHYHFAEKLPWVAITDDLPKYPGSAESTVLL